MREILVTGAAGFIGSSITTELVNLGKKVRAIDNLSTGFLENLAPIRNKIEFIPGDIRNQDLLWEACKGVDTIFHQAAIASVQRSIEDPVGTREVNLDATLHLIRIAAQAGVRRFVFASSSAVYGNPVTLPIRESAAINPLSNYATQKRQCEIALQEARREHGMETVTLRYFNVFGPRQAPGSPYSGVIARFAEQMLNEDNGVSDVTIFGDGEQTRDFIYIEDVVAANIAAMTAPAEGVAGHIFNIGTGHGRSILEIAQNLASVAGYHGAIRYLPPRTGDVLHSVADTLQAEEKLGFKAATPFRDGLAHTAAWMQSQLLTRKAGPISIASHATRRNAPRSTPRSITETVEHGGFRLAYQPIVSTESSQPAAVEALLRSSEEKAFFSPSTIIRSAEQSGEIHLLGRWVLNQACLEGARLVDRLGRDLRICVNVSPSQLEDSTFAAYVEDTLRRTSIRPATLEIEITESVLADNPGRVKRTLHALREIGVSIALDDFGTGYANMQQLCQLNVQRLKIDRSILHATGSFGSVFPALCGFAKSLKLPVVVEGVETHAQFARAAEAGCEECQGFLIGRPAAWEIIATNWEKRLHVA